MIEATYMKEDNKCEPSSAKSYFCLSAVNKCSYQLDALSSEALCVEFLQYHFLCINCSEIPKVTGAILTCHIHAFEAE